MDHTVCHFEIPAEEPARAAKYAIVAAEQAGDSLARPQVEMPEEAIVEWNDHTRRQDPEIARMRVGMKEAELENLLEQDASAGDGDFLRRQLGLAGVLGGLLLRLPMPL